MKIWKFWRKVVGRQIILAANQTYKELLKKGKVGRKNLFRWVNLSANELYMRGAGGPKLEAALGRSPICGFANSQPQTHRPQPSQRMNETKRWWRWTDTHREFIILGDQFQSGSFWKVNCNIVCKFFSWKHWLCILPPYTWKWYMQQSSTGCIGKGVIFLSFGFATDNGLFISSFFSQQDLRGINDRSKFSMFT